MGVKYYLHAGMYWVLKEDEIMFYFSNLDLRTGIRSSNNKLLFELLKQLKDPKTRKELIELSLFDQEEDLDMTLNYLLENKYISVFKEVDHIVMRLRSYTDSIPYVKFEDYFCRLHEVSICILGVGTGGSYIPEGLLKLGLHDLTLIDHDKVEEKNLYAQNYFPEDVGKYKVQALEKRYRQLNKQLKVFANKVNGFNDLSHLIDVKKTNYLLVCADDIDLTINLLKNVFEVNSEIKVILTGYAVFQQYTRMINVDDYKFVLKEMMSENQSMSDQQEIAENNGVIFNALFSALTISKMIFDDMLNISNAKISTADFLKNKYLLGNEIQIQLEDKLERERSSVNQIFYDVGNKMVSEDKWIRDLTLDNLFNDNLIKRKAIYKELEPFLRGDEMSHFKRFMDYKDRITDEMRVDQKVSKEALLVRLFTFIKERFSEKDFLELKAIVDNGFIQDKKTLFSSAKPQTVNDNGFIFINNVINNEHDLHAFNTLIHEVFHALFYIQGEKNVFVHESFVLKQQISFLKKHLYEKDIYEMSRAFVLHNVNEYITSMVACEYEKYTYNGDINGFIQKWDGFKGHEDELLQILNHHINNSDPLFSYRYVYAMNQNFAEFDKLVTLFAKSHLGQ
ncbi:ThiF family adenylyltransferase [Shouchella lonarensis]|uniref:ThiF family protein n=1 Tax=Shouchella lonarensis TaxID=1464122 RepID=A0A1G6N8D9_9BACI|nr:ThiF family adenylyltransferase [Shouchella lonarensis]SDC63704.1 ThiF family protein [Shouchella lonarensis]